MLPALERLEVVRDPQRIIAVAKDGLRRSNGEPIAIGVSVGDALDRGRRYSLSVPLPIPGIRNITTSITESNFRANPDGEGSELDVAGRTRLGSRFAGVDIVFDYTARNDQAGLVIDTYQLEVSRLGVTPPGMDQLVRRQVEAVVANPLGEARRLINPQLGKRGELISMHVGPDVEAGLIAVFK